MYIIEVSFYGDLFPFHGGIYVIPRQNAEEAMALLSKQIDYEYGGNTYVINSMKYLANATLIN